MFQTRTKSNTGRKFIIYCKIKTGTPKFFAQISLCSETVKNIITFKNSILKFNFKKKKKLNFKPITAFTSAL